MKKFEFGNHDTIPAIGLGTWKANGKELKKAVKDAIYAGYRLIDTATNYGNEKIIGEALAEVFSEGEIFREDLFITSKLWNDCHCDGDVIPALEESLRHLQMDYLDLYLIHWPVAFRHGVEFPQGPDDYLPLSEVPSSETWEQMEKAKNLGLARHIGVSNFSEKKLKELITSAGIKPEMLQIELHPLLQQKSLLEYCKKNNILVTAYSPLGSGDRSSSMKASDEPNMLDIDLLKEIAEAHGATVPQILIAWNVNRGCTVIPKSTTKEHIISNLEAYSIELGQEEMKKIENLDRNYRYINGKFFDAPSKGYENIYDE